MIEAEHHAVWTDGGALLDVTPHPPACEQRILFVPDPESVYDFASMRRRDNVRRSLGAVPAADDLVEATARLCAYVESRSAGRLVTMERDVLSALHSAAAQARGRVIEHLARATPPGSTCIYRRGRKFRKCCLPFIRLS